MKILPVKAILYPLLVAAMAACSTAGPQSTESPKPTESKAPTSTHTPEPTKTPTPPPTATLESPAFITYQIAANAPAKDVQLIQEGIEIEHWWAESLPGGDPNDGNAMTVVIDASGKGNEGSCCTALSHNLPRPYFDTAHPVWLNNEQDGIFNAVYGNNDEKKLLDAAHEYAHTMQAMWGCLGAIQPPMWWSEGWAEYAASAARAARGRGTMDEARAYWRESLNNGAGSGVTIALNQEETANGFALNYTRGYGQGFFAVNALADTYGVPALVEACKLLKDERSLSAVFPKAFNGLTLSDFYQQVFPAYLAEALK